SGSAPVPETTLRLRGGSAETEGGYLAHLGAAVRLRRGEGQSGDQASFGRRDDLGLAAQLFGEGDHQGAADPGRSGVGHARAVVLHLQDAGVASDAEAHLKVAAAPGEGV